jgi:hypothetical protein
LFNLYGPLFTPREMLLFGFGAAVLLVFKYTLILIREGWGGDKTFAQKQEAQSRDLMLGSILLSLSMEWLDKRYTWGGALGFMFFFGFIFSIDYRLSGYDLKWWQILLIDIAFVLIFPFSWIGFIAPAVVLWLARKNQFPSQQNQE